MRSDEFYFGRLGVLGEHMKSGRDHTKWKFVLVSSKNPRLYHYKGSILAYDYLCVQKIKIKMEIRSPEIILSI